jgi:hypothetical protein
MKSGLRGRNAGLVRIDGSNALGDESAKSWRAVAWRNESVHGQFVAWSKNGADRLRASVSALETADGHRLPASAVRTRFVRYVVGHATYKGKLTHPERLFGDCLDDAQQLYLPPFGYRPVWLTVKVPADAQPGVYRGKLTIRANAHDKLEFPLELTVRSRTLPPPSQWKTYLDLWQHPWAVARYHRSTVTPLPGSKPRSRTSRPGKSCSRSKDGMKPKIIGNGSCAISSGMSGRKAGSVTCISRLTNLHPKPCARLNAFFVATLPV